MKEISYLISHYIEAFIIFIIVILYSNKKIKFFCILGIYFVLFYFIWNLSFSEYLCKHHRFRSCSIVFNQLFI